MLKPALIASRARFIAGNLRAVESTLFKCEVCQELSLRRQAATEGLSNSLRLLASLPASDARRRAADDEVDKFIVAIRDVRTAINEHKKVCPEGG